MAGVLFTHIILECGGLLPQATGKPVESRALFRKDFRRELRKIGLEAEDGEEE
ncbi:MAG: hypothetical protein Q8M58_07965 [Anaerolineales bacterium]|nr:hypothetical protein [Anaerolineales bacterium]